MLSNEEIVERLRHLLSLVEEAEKNVEPRRRFRHREHPLWECEVEERLFRIQGRLDELIKRASTSCRLSDAEFAFGEYKFMVAANQEGRAKGVCYLSEWIGSTESLTIADPYLIKHGGPISVDEYTKTLGSLLPFSITRLELFVGPRTPRYWNQDVANSLNTLCAKRKIDLIVFHQELVHDRVWIKEGTDALVVGTSFNGLGNKCAFLLTLDESDRASFCEELARIRANCSSSTQV